MEPLADAATLPDLIARGRRTQEQALLAADDRRQRYTYHRFCTTAWKTGNFLRHLGVRDDARVAIADDRGAAQPVLALFGTVLLGGVAWIGAPRTVDARAVVAPVDDVEEYDLPDGSQRAGYGGDPSEAGIYHFEEQVWSENPTRVPREYDPDATVLTDGERTYSHRSLLEGGGDVIDTLGLRPGDRVGVRAPLSDPRTVAAGVLAPLIVGGTVVLVDGVEVDAVVGTAADADDAPGLDVEDVSLDSR